mmetsp:Transcript_72495/g.193732  ORF Transcript_72495/g.193732 Transcript_72495/m.193732 type:complete len:153 (-) Transcript_72495:164-622(-)
MQAPSLRRSGTYELITTTKDEVVCNLLTKMKDMLKPLHKMSPSLDRLANTLLSWAEAATQKKTLCKFYIIWKLHKKANHLGVRSRPIASNIGYATAQLSHFRHCQLQTAVFGHPHVLRDSLTLIRELEQWRINDEDNVDQLTADVAATLPVN